MRHLFLDKNIIAVKEVAQPLLETCAVLVGVRYSFLSPNIALELFMQESNSLLHNVPYKVKKVLESVRSSIYSTVNSLPITTHKIGYSCSGQVIAVGAKVSHIRTGDYVACVGNGYATHADLVCVPESFVTKVTHETQLKMPLLLHLELKQLK